MTREEMQKIYDEKIASISPMSAIQIYVATRSAVMRMRREGLKSQSWQNAMMIALGNSLEGIIGSDLFDAIIDEVDNSIYPELAESSVV